MIPSVAARAAAAAGAGAGAGEQHRRAGPLHVPLDQLGQGPGGGAVGEQAGRQAPVADQPGGAGHGRHGTDSTGLHDEPQGRVKRVGQAVDRAERPGLTAPHLVGARRVGGDQHPRCACAEPDPRIGQQVRLRLRRAGPADRPAGPGPSRCGPQQACSRCARPGRHGGAGPGPAWAVPRGAGRPEQTLARSWKAQQRLHATYAKLTRRGKIPRWRSPRSPASWPGSCGPR